MTKKTLIALADAIRAGFRATPGCWTQDQVLDLLADFCAQQNPAFKRDRWIGYVRGENGPNGGKRSNFD